jgi:hypothetical protein
MQYWILFLFTTLFLNGCSFGNNDKRLDMGVYHRISPELIINVLSYKLIRDKSELPLMPSAPPNSKYIAINLIIKNTGEHKGRPSATFIDKYEKGTLTHSSLGDDKSLPISFDFMQSDLMKFNGDRGIAFQSIPPGGQLIGWYVALIPSNLNPPYTLTLIPSWKNKSAPKLSFKLQ